MVFDGVIFHRHRCVFFHIGKTAGVSIEKWLDNNSYDVTQSNTDVMFGWDKEKSVYLQHASMHLTQEMVDSETFNNYYKFSVVRNPYSRAISVYYYLYDQHQKKFGSFENYIHTLPELLKSPNIYNGSHHIPQTYYTHIEGTCFCDHIAKFEELPSSLSKIQKQLNLNLLPQHYNRYSHPQRQTRPRTEIYSKKMIQIMQDIYAGDFEKFDYDPLP